MSVGKQLQRLFELTHWTIRENLRSVDDHESLLRPLPTGNCINWVLGHILQNRDRALELLEEPPIWTGPEKDRYARGTPPIDPEEDVVVLGRMLDLLELSQARLLECLEDEDRLGRKQGEGTLGSELFVFNFHESYHAGQLGILRRAIGKDCAIP